MLKISLGLEVLCDWKRRAGDERRPAYFVKPAVIVDLSSRVEPEPEAAYSELSFYCQSVSVAPLEYPINSPQVHPVPVGDQESMNQRAARRCLDYTAMLV